MPDPPKLSVSPTSLLTEFMPLLDNNEERSYLQLANGVGSKDISKPRRAVERYLDVVEIFGLTNNTSTGSKLTIRGMRFRGDPAVSKAAVREVFHSGAIPASVAKAITVKTSLSKGDAKNILAVLGRDAELERWIEWLEYAEIISVGADAISVRPGGSRVLDLYTPNELSAIEEERYRHLAAIGYADIHSASPSSYRSIGQALGDFRDASPEKAEPLMQRFVQAAFAALGIVVQVQNGPRETSAPSKKAKVQFGSEGEDAVGFFLHPPGAAAESSLGCILVMELKRTASDKRAVGQARTAAGQWSTYFEGRATVLALTVSDSETYAEKSAREYAATNSIVHLPMEAISRLVGLQKELYENARPLITPVHIWTLLENFSRSSYTEPTTEDVVHGIQGLLEIATP